MTFNQFCRQFRITPQERRKLKVFLAAMRMGFCETHRPNQAK